MYNVQLRARALRRECKCLYTEHANTNNSKSFDTNYT